MGPDGLTYDSVKLNYGGTSGLVFSANDDAGKDLTSLLRTLGSSLSPEKSSRNVAF